MLSRITGEERTSRKNISPALVNHLLELGHCTPVVRRKENPLSSVRVFCQERQFVEQGESSNDSKKVSSIPLLRDREYLPSSIENYFCGYAKFLHPSSAVRFHETQHELSQVQDETLNRKL